MKVIVLPTARADLERIGDTIAVDNPGRSITFVAELTHRCATLADSPTRRSGVPSYLATNPTACGERSLATI